MLEPRGELDLALEAVGADRGGQLGVQHLQGDGAVVADVADEVDGGHAAAAELALDGVAVCQRGLERGPVIRGHFVSLTSRRKSG